MVGGQLAHAHDHSRAASACQGDHSESEQNHSESGDSDAAGSHHCCHMHSPASVGRSYCHGMMIPKLADDILTKSDILPDPPVQEIEYPPQLS